jgi:hypothetical protein
VDMDDESESWIVNRPDIKGISQAKSRTGTTTPVLQRVFPSARTGTRLRRPPTRGMQRLGVNFEEHRERNRFRVVKRIIGATEHGME